MAKSNSKDKKAPKNSGANCWTSNNGYGITLKPPTKEQQAAVDRVNAELAAEAAAVEDAKKYRGEGDRWTSNGLGIQMAPPTEEQKKRVEALNRELAEEYERKRRGRSEES